MKQICATYVNYDVELHSDESMTYLAMDADINTIRDAYKLLYSYARGIS